MPVNAKHHGKCEEGIAPKSTPNFRARGRLQNAADAGLNQGAVVVAMVNPGDNALSTRLKRAHEPKFIVPFNFAKR